MIDTPSRIDPLVGAGPILPASTLRPGTRPQCLLVLNNGSAQAVDLASSTVRPWENAPHIALPARSTPFDLAAFNALQFQLTRDVREPARTTTLVSLRIAQSVVVEICESPAGLLVIDDGVSMATGPIGESPHIVVTFTIDRHDGYGVSVTARNAETLAEVRAEIALAALDPAVITLGGPSVSTAQRVARRRSTPVHIHVTRHVEPADQLRSAVGRARRVAGSLKDRIG